MRFLFFSLFDGILYRDELEGCVFLVILIEIIYLLFFFKIFGNIEFMGVVISLVVF